MPLPRVRLRTLMIAVAVAAACLAGFRRSAGLGLLLTFGTVSGCLWCAAATEVAARRGREITWRDTWDAFREGAFAGLLAYCPVAVMLAIARSILSSP